MALRNWPGKPYLFWRNDAKNKGHYTVHGHSRSSILVPIESTLFDFLLVINTNLPPILHRFQVMAEYISNFR